MVVFLVKVNSPSEVWRTVFPNAVKFGFRLSRIAAGFDSAQ